MDPFKLINQINLNQLDSQKKSPPPDPKEGKIAAVLESEDGALLLNWLADRTINKRIDQQYADGLKSALETYRSLGQIDVYMELINLVKKWKKIK